MINEKNIKKVVSTISEKFSAYLIYMLEYEKGVNLIFVSKNLLDDNIIKTVEMEVASILECEVGILDMHEFDEADRVEIMQRAEMIYCQNMLEKRLFEIEATSAYKILMEQRQSLMERKQECATFYLQ